MPILNHCNLHLPSIWSLLDVLIKMNLDTLKCYLWNVVLIVNPHFVQWEIEIEIKKYLINCWSWFACFNIWNTSFQIYSFFNFITLNVTSSLCFRSNGIQKHGWLEFCSKNGWSLTMKWRNQIVGFFSSFTIVHSIFHILGDLELSKIETTFLLPNMTSNIQLMDIRFIGF